jgi:hypothetical protein
MANNKILSAFFEIRPFKKTKLIFISCVVIYENIMIKVILKAGVIIDWRSDVCVCTARDELLLS